MSELVLCRCGQPAHPLYGNRCEDCWALDGSPHYVSEDGKIVDCGWSTLPQEKTYQTGGGTRVIRSTNTLGG